jgi:hypothetical protein
MSPLTAKANLGSEPVMVILDRYLGGGSVRLHQANPPSSSHSTRYLKSRIPLLSTITIKIRGIRLRGQDPV